MPQTSASFSFILWSPLVEIIYYIIPQLIYLYISGHVDYPRGEWLAWRGNLLILSHLGCAAQATDYPILIHLQCTVQWTTTKEEEPVWHIRGSSSVGRIVAFKAIGRGFKSCLPCHKQAPSTLWCPVPEITLWSLLVEIIYYIDYPRGGWLAWRGNLLMLSHLGCAVQGTD